MLWRFGFFLKKQDTNDFFILLVIIIFSVLAIINRVNQFISFFKTFDLFICPTVILPPYDVNKRYISEINGKKLDNYIQSLILTSALTLTGCPIISIPCGFTSNNLPVGLQIMSKWNSEATLLSAAHMIEQELNIFNKVPIDPRTN